MEEEHQGLVSSLPKRGDQDLCAEEGVSKVGQARGALMTVDLLSSPSDQQKWELVPHRG